MVIITFCKISENNIVEKETAVHEKDATHVKNVLEKYGYVILNEERF